jgi:hypothetical protein
MLGIDRCDQPTQPSRPAAKWGAKFIPAWVPNSDRKLASV